jgi:aerobic-type carbon monoxide dehydrogenase small subunit (CoxS/CutS family)
LGDGKKSPGTHTLKYVPTVPSIVVSLVVNDEPRAVALRSADRTLLSVLRDDLGLTGAKEGCGIGVCGACTVIVNGQMVSSCIQLAALVDGAEVRTVEGLGGPDGLDPVQQAFVVYGGVQCGACTPGQVMAARALLDECPSPTVEQVREWMTGNLCRCTGYYKIVESILAAARL